MEMALKRWSFPKLVLSGLMAGAKKMIPAKRNWTTQNHPHFPKEYHSAKPCQSQAQDIKEKS